MTRAALLLAAVLTAGAGPAQEDGASEPAATAAAAAADPAELGPAELDRLTAEVADRLRCPVCRNQSVLESSSELARRMQSVIRDRLAAGETPEQVEAYFVERYGEWILLQPKAEGLNLVAYLLPPLLLLGGGLLVRDRLRRWRERGRDAGRDGLPTGSPGEAGSGGDGRRAPPAAGPAGGGEAVPATEDEERWLEEVIRQA